MKLILIRHGQSTGNLQQTQYQTTPDNQIPLTSVGILQAEQAGLSLVDYFKNDKLFFYHSPWKRAKDTCNIICNKLDSNNIIKIIESPVIHEQRYTYNFQDMLEVSHIPYEDNDRQRFGPFWYKKDSIETFSEVYERAMIFWNHLRLTHKNEENVIIVSHGHFLQIFQMVVGQLNIEEFESIASYNNCEIRILEYEF